mgnify:CR=1 FL=1
MNTMPTILFIRHIKLFCLVFTAAVFCMPLNGWSQAHEPNCFYEVLLDVDRDTGTDVTVNQHGGTAVKKGIDYKVRALAYLSGTMADPSHAVVVGTQVLKWNSTGFEIIKTCPDSYPVGINTGKGNSHTVEIAADLADLGNPDGIMRGSFHAGNMEGSGDFTDDFEFGQGPDASSIPALSGRGMIMLAVLLIILASAFIKKGNRARPLAFIILAVTGAAAIAWAAGFLPDGEVSDWDGIDPVITDAVWDSSSGDPGKDILYGFVQREENRLYFRLDINPAVQQLPPEVTLSADPEAIEAGNSSTLNWTSANAISCIIGSGIRNVDLNGSVSVSPLETTVYTITASGTGGTATDSVTITVNEIPPPAPPTADITADPEEIVIGESSTLTWSSTNAESVSIDQGIGSVDVNGSETVSPTETITYSITATGPGGTVTDSVVITAVDPIKLNISSPSWNDTVSGTSVMVLGTVTNKRGNETGVIVNGMPAVVTDGHFVANHVPLQQGENTITVNARDINGFIASASITVNASIPGDYIRLTADTESGIVPFDTTLTLEGSFTFINPSITYTGPGTVEFPDNQNENEYTVRMTVPGIYYFTASAEDGHNNTCRDTIAIEVMDKDQLDDLLRDRWDRMKAALANQDIQSAINYFYEGSKELYRDIYTAIYDKLPQLIQDMKDIEWIYVEDNLAKYRIRKNEVYGGQNLIITYYIYFEKDEYGLWKIYRY